MRHLKSFFIILMLALLPLAAFAERSYGGSKPRPPITLQKTTTIGWNDKISAIEWVLVYDFTKFMGDHPDLPHTSC